jgi:hypothetical protein
MIRGKRHPLADHTSRQKWIHFHLRSMETTGGSTTNNVDRLDGSDHGGIAC